MFCFFLLDYTIYTWGEDKHGQLGHGEETAWKNDPQCVSMLLDKHVTQLNTIDFGRKWYRLI